MSNFLYVVGENIPAGLPVAISAIDGRLYRGGERAGTYFGDAGEDLRDGFRARKATNGNIYEDDA